MALYLILIYIVIILFLLRFVYVNKSFSKNDPIRPGWLAIPLFGHFYKVDFLKPFYEVSNHTMKLAKHKVISFWFMDMYMMLILNPKTARDFLVKNSDNFLNRPITYATQVLTHNFASMANSRDERWNTIRHAFSPLSTNLILRKKTYYVEEKIKETMEYVTKNHLDDKVETWKFTKPMLINIFYEYFQISEPITQTMRDKDTWDLIEGVFEIVSKTNGKPLLNSHFFGLFFGLYYKLTNLKILEKPYNIISKKLIQPHYETIDRLNPRDTIDELILLNESYPKDQQFEHNILAPLIDFFNAGINSTSLLMEWFMLIMANNQDVQEKLYNELSNVDKEFISIKNRNETPFLNSVLNEVIRYRLGASTAPREAKEDIEINGVFVPKKSAVAILTSTIFMDQDYWDEPNIFKADRFIGEPKGHMERILLYGLSKRNCIGKNLANDINYLFCSNIILNYKIKSPNGKLIDDEPVFRLNSAPKSHYIKFEKRVN